MLNCREVTRITAGEDRKLGFFARMELRMHLFMCVKCRNYVRQIRTMGRNMRRLIRDDAPTPTEMAALEQRICRHLADDHGA